MGGRERAPPSAPQGPLPSRFWWLAKQWFSPLGGGRMGLGLEHLAISLAWVRMAFDGDPVGGFSLPPPPTLQGQVQHV